MYPSQYRVDPTVYVPENKSNTRTYPSNRHVKYNTSIHDDLDKRNFERYNNSTFRRHESPTHPKQQQQQRRRRRQQHMTTVSPRIQYDNYNSDSRNNYNSDSRNNSNSIRYKPARKKHNVRRESQIHNYSIKRSHIENRQSCSDSRDGQYRESRRRQQQQQRQQQRRQQQQIESYSTRQREPDLFEHVINVTNHGITSLLDFKRFNVKWLVPVFLVGTLLSIFHIRSKRVLSNNIIHFPKYVGFSMPVPHNPSSVNESKGNDGSVGGDKDENDNNNNDDGDNTTTHHIMSAKNKKRQKYICTIQWVRGDTSTHSDPNQKSTLGKRTIDRKMATTTKSKRRHFIRTLKDKITSMKFVDPDQYTQLSRNSRALLHILSKRNVDSLYSMDRLFINRSLDLDILQSRETVNDENTQSRTTTSTPLHMRQIKYRKICDRIMGEIEMWCEVMQNRLSELFKVPIFPVRKFLYRNVLSGGCGGTNSNHHDHHGIRMNSMYNDEDIDPFHQFLISPRGIQPDKYKHSWRYGICVRIDLTPLYTHQDMPISQHISQSSSSSSSPPPQIHLIKLECETFTSLLYTRDIEAMGARINSKIDTLRQQQHHVPKSFETDTQLMLLFYTRPIHIVGL